MPTTAFLCPGQGAHDASMIDAVREAPGFGEARSIVAAALGYDPVEGLAKDPSIIAQNEVASLVTLLVSCLRQRVLQQKGHRFAFAAGYSVGQWGAMHFAGMIDFEQLVRVVRQRSQFMDACMPDGCAMLAVIGMRVHALERLIEWVRSATDATLEISNFNCVGQYTVAGEARGIDALAGALAAARADCRPKKVERLSVSGAWHTSLLRDAAAEFLRYLSDEEFQPPRVPVIDNTTGGFLPTDGHALRERLARHVDSPVRWDAGVRTLLDRGVTRFVEIGHGRVLGKFGFFLARDAEHFGCDDLERLGG